MDESVIRKELFSLYKKYHKAELLGQDPLGLVNASLDDRDFEFVSYVSASLSYGRVEQIRKSLMSLWSRLEPLLGNDYGQGFHSLLVNNSWKTLNKELSLLLEGWVHRFNQSEDLLVLFKVLHRVSRETGSLGVLYAVTKNECPTIKLIDFASALTSIADKSERKLLSWYVCSPSGGSTCKRMVMWLRWMLRKDAIDPGIWSMNSILNSKGIGPHLAFIPMDTHIHRWAMEKKLLSTKNPSWKAVEELTVFLRKIDPVDPARFDFCICHYGMEKFRNSTKGV